MRQKDLAITNLTQTELAKKLNVRQPLVSRWLSGKVIPRPSTIQRIADATGTSSKNIIEYIYSQNKNIEL
jgi:transcriptional regulator with XRE-family HTH domain